MAENKFEEYKKDFLKLYEHENNYELKEICDYIKKYDRYDMISNELSRDYSSYQVCCMSDDDGNRYVLHNGRKVYFPNKYSEILRYPYILLSFLFLHTVKYTYHTLLIHYLSDRLLILSYQEYCQHCP